MRTKALRAKLDQMQRRVLVSATTHRTFGKQQWTQLRDDLDAWQRNLQLIMGSLETVTAAGGGAHRPPAAVPPPHASGI